MSEYMDVVLFLYSKKTEGCTNMQKEQAEKLIELAKLKFSYQTIIEASVYIVKLNEIDGAVMPQFIESMESLRMPLLQMIAQQNILSPLAKSTLTALNHAIQYAKTKDNKARVAMVEEYKRGDRIAKHLKKSGVFND